MNLQLREYQQHQNDAIRVSFKIGNRRIISCIATGSGKSAMLADLAKSMLDKSAVAKVLIVLPRRSLVVQLAESFTGWGISHGIIMAGVTPFHMARVQIASIDTYLSRLSNGYIDLFGAEMLIIDEMHLQFTPKKLELFSHYQIVIGFSATPIAPKNQSLGIFYQDIIETITMQELMDQGFLTPLKCFSRPGIDLSGLKTDADGDYRESMLGGVMDKPQLVGDIYANWKRLAAGKPTVIFASSQSHARHLCAEFNSHGWSFEYVDCTFSDDDRQAIFERVRNGKTTGICNVGIVSVGIDIPNLECVVLARPTKLISIYLQCVGRVTRICSGKQIGIVIDHAGIIEKIGLPTDRFEWSLDGKETVEDRAQRKKEEKSEPKQITCFKCETVFVSRRSCPSCGFEVIPKGEPIPTHQAELKEVISLPKPADKQSWYAQLLFIAMKKGYSEGWASHKFNEKFGHFPAKRRGISPIEPGQEVTNFLKHLAIKNSYRRGAA